MRTNGGCWLRVTHHHLYVSESSGQTGMQVCELGNFIVKKKSKGGLRCVPTGGCWHEESARGLTGSGASYVIYAEGIFGLL